MTSGLPVIHSESDASAIAASNFLDPDFWIIVQMAGSTRLCGITWVDGYIPLATSYLLPALSANGA
jgi:hypothetical protein